MGAREVGVVVAAAAVLVWVTADVLSRGLLTSLDQWVSRLVRATGVRGAHSWHQALFWVKVGVYALTQFGSRTPVLAVMVPFLAWLAWRARRWRPVLLLAAAITLLTVSGYLLKDLVGRTAPATDTLHVPAGQSFPSGHAAIATLMWGLAAWLAADYAAPGPLPALLGLLRWVAPTLTVAAMLLLDYHWLTDLVAGLALGIIVLGVLRAADALFGGPRSGRDRPGPTGTARSQSGPAELVGLACSPGRSGGSLPGAEPAANRRAGSDPTRPEPAAGWARSEPASGPGPV